MTETAIFVLTFFAGFVLGLLFFGGLWWTIQIAVVAKHPAIWFIGSLVTRMSIVLLGFYFVAGGAWQRMLSCLAGFVVGRLVVTAFVRPSVNRPTTELRSVLSKEADHVAHP